MLLFWQSVTEYGAAEERSADRLLRMCHAWTIYNNHIAPNSYHYIGEWTLFFQMNINVLSLHKFYQRCMFYSWWSKYR